MLLAGLQHVIWDWNGSLLDDAWLCRDAMNELLCRRRLPALSVARYQEIFDFPVENYYRRAGFDFTRESFAALSVEFMATYERRKYECALRPDARRVLDAIRAAGLTQSVLSAYKQDLLEEMLDHFRLRDYFVRVLGADDIYASGKIRQGRDWIAALGCPPAAVALVGDTVHDFAVARAMGTACLLIPGGNQTRARLEQCGVPVLDSLAGLLD